MTGYQLITMGSSFTSFTSEIHINASLFIIQGFCTILKWAILKQYLLLVLWVYLFLILMYYQISTGLLFDQFTYTALHCYFYSMKRSEYSYQWFNLILSVSLSLCLSVCLSVSYQQSSCLSELSGRMQARPSNTDDVLIAVLAGGLAFLSIVTLRLTWGA